MKITFSLILPRDAQSVPLVRRICRHAFDVLGVAEDCVSPIEVAVSEACTNVLNHVEGTPEEYEVNVCVDEEVCSISVIDTGTGFDHTRYDFEGDEDSLSVTSEGGRGIFLMRAMVDELEFTSEPAKGTIVHIVKKLDFQPHSALRQLTGSFS